MRSAKRTKSLDIVPLDEDRARFELTLEDRSFDDTGGELIHSLEIKGLISLPELEILEIEPKAFHQPYAECGASLEPVRKMVGARIGAGFRARVFETMGRTLGCTHFMTLLLDLTSAHTLSTFLRMRARVPMPQRETPTGNWLRIGLEIEPRLENACTALSTQSPIIRDARDNVTEPSE